MEMFRRPGGDVIRHGQPGRRLCSRRRDFLDPVASPGHALPYGAQLEEEADGMDRHRITAAEVSAKGAELVSLRDAAETSCFGRRAPNGRAMRQSCFPSSAGSATTRCATTAGPMRSGSTASPAQSIRMDGAQRRPRGPAPRRFCRDAQVVSLPVQPRTRLRRRR